MMQTVNSFNARDFFNTLSVSELYDTVYPPRQPVVENLLYTGTYLFAGAPKVGKSFLMAQLAYHVSSGTDLWGYSVRQGTVLYLALEADYGRLQQRLSRMYGTEDNDNLHLAICAKQLGSGLAAQLISFFEVHPETRLVIIDTLQQIRDIGGELYSYASDYEIVKQIKRLSDESGVCVLLVHHTRKQTAEDAFDTISGTNGLLGAADGAFVLQKKRRTDNSATLDITGRDQQDQKLHLEFDHDHCIWNLTSAETELWVPMPDPILSIVADIVSADNPVWCGSATELASMITGEEISANALTRRLNVGVEMLLTEHGVRYENSRNHAGRQIILTLASAGDGGKA
jgi:RecA-family ATPase